MTAISRTRPSCCQLSVIPPSTAGPRVPKAVTRSGISPCCGSSVFTRTLAPCAKGATAPPDTMRADKAATTQTFFTVLLHLTETYAEDSCLRQEPSQSRPADRAELAARPKFPLPSRHD